MYAIRSYYDSAIGTEHGYRRSRRHILDVITSYSIHYTKLYELIVGIVIGTVSSIYVASPLALWLGISRANMAVRKTPEEEAESMP